MYVHIGGEYQIPAKTIIAILNLDAPETLEPGSVNQRLLQAAEEQNLVEVVDWEVPRSFILTLERVYLSPIAASTLRKRLTAAQRDWKQAKKRGIPLLGMRTGEDANDE